MKNVIGMGVALALAAAPARAAEVVVTVHLADEGGAGREVGSIRATDTAHGTLFTPDLRGLPPGLHGFHVHEHAHCGPAEKDGAMTPGLAAGSHYDPGKTGKHLGPYGEGHLGDLPPLFVDAEGAATLPVLAPRLKVSDLKGHSLMIHAGGDNYSDEPKPLGGGGARIACGVVEAEN
jgi:Cu-Zn family superoxide dismutase